MLKPKFARGERVVIRKSGPLRNKTGRIAVAGFEGEQYAVILDDPLETRDIAIIKRDQLQSELAHEQN